MITAHLLGQPTGRIAQIKYVGKLVEHHVGPTTVMIPDGAFKPGDLVLHVPGNAILTGEIQKQIRSVYDIMYYTANGLNMNSRLPFGPDEDLPGGLVLKATQFFGPKLEFKDPQKRQWRTVQPGDFFDYSFILGVTYQAAQDTPQDVEEVVVPSMGSTHTNEPQPGAESDG